MWYISSGYEIVKNNYMGESTIHYQGVQKPKNFLHILSGQRFIRALYSQDGIVWLGRLRVPWIAHDKKRSGLSVKTGER